MSYEQIKKLSEERANIGAELSELVTRQHTEKRELTAEENDKFSRLNEALDTRMEQIDALTKNAMAELQSAERENRFRELAKSEVATTDKPAEDVRSIFAQIASGDIKSYNFGRENRGLTPGNTPVPTSFYDRVFELGRAQTPMFTASTLIETASGENITIPTLTAYSTAAITAAGSAISESNPTFSSITLGAWRDAVIVKVSNDLLKDEGFDVAEWVERQAAEAINLQVGALLTTGTGTVQPTGVVTAASSAVTGGTGVSGAFTFANLVDLYYGVDDAVIGRGNLAFMGNKTAHATARKLVDTTGQPVLAINPQAGQPDTIFGSPFLYNPSMSNVGTGVKSLLFGDFKSYVVRVAGGLEVTRDASIGFGTDETWFRIQLRADGNLTHASHVAYFKGGAS